MENDKLCQKRLRKAKTVGTLLACLPFVRCVILNGSLAQSKSKASSDIDILIIAKNGRIFTARFLVNVFALIFGIKRPKDDSKSHAGKFCFNYFLTENYLKIPVGRGEKIDKYCAENYSASKFIAGDRELFKKFLKENEKLFNRYNCHPELPLCHPERSEGSSKQSKRAPRQVEARFFAKAQNDIRKILDYLFGDWFEKTIKKYQIKKIESDPRTKNYPDLIVYNDQELRFHPPKS